MRRSPPRSLAGALRPAPLVLLALVAVLALLAACHQAPQAPRVTDGARSDGGAADAGQPARRVVSLVPSATEMLFALGAGDRVVGVSAFDDYPPEVTRLPRIGGMVNPSFEAIVALRPDAIVGVQGPINMAVIDRLRGMGVRAVFPQVESIAQVQSSIDAFAALVGRQEAARALHARIAADIARVRAAVQGTPRPRVLAVFSQRPLVVAGPGSWFDEILQIAGGSNVDSGGTRYPMVSIEQVLGWRPDVVIDLTWHEGNGALETAWAGYAAIPAVRDHRIVRIDNPVLVRQGPRIGEAAAVLARVLHPGVHLE